MKEVIEGRNRRKKITSEESGNEDNSDTSIDTADSEEIIQQLKKRGTTPGKRFVIREHKKLKNNTYCFKIINEQTKSARWCHKINWKDLHLTRYSSTSTKII